MEQRGGSLAGGVLRRETWGKDRLHSEGGTLAPGAEPERVGGQVRAAGCAGDGKVAPPCAHTWGGVRVHTQKRTCSCAHLTHTLLRPGQTLRRVTDWLCAGSRPDSIAGLSRFGKWEQGWPGVTCQSLRRGVGGTRRKQARCHRSTAGAAVTQASRLAGGCPSDCRGSGEQRASGGPGSVPAPSAVKARERPGRVGVVGQLQEWR